MNDSQTSEWLDAFPDSSVSARRILPIVFELAGRPTRLLDLGGGIGSWSQVALELGVPEVTLVDHPATGDGDQLLVPSAAFRPCDFEREAPEPVSADLALCLEMAEHVSANRADTIVDALVASAPVILFSASIPGQPGHGHVNEQPPTYWRTKFCDRDYTAVDAVRPRILGDTDLPYWYRQNIMMFVRAGHPLAAMAPSPFLAVPEDFELVHTSILARYRLGLRPPGVRRWLRSLPDVLRESARTHQQK